MLPHATDLEYSTLPGYSECWVTPWNNSNNQLLKKFPVQFHITE